MITIRTLGAEEYGKLEGHPYFRQYGLPHPDFSHLTVAETESGRIVGCWCMVQVVHLEPIWIDPAYRSGLLVYRMWTHLKSLLDALRITRAFSFCDRSDIEGYLTRLGFTPLNLKIFQYTKDA